LAIVLSPFPIIPAILLLFAVHPRSTSSAFLGGWFAGLFIATTVFVVVGGFVESQDSSPVWLAWARLGVGIALIVLGGQHWIERKKSKPAPKWMQSLQTATPRRAATLGILLSAANPKIVLLCAAAGVSIGAANESVAGTAAITIAFSVAGSFSVGVPVVAFLVAGDRVLTPLGKARDWLDRNNAAVMAVVIFAIGVALVVKGVQSF
jgi:threonine/homoserine/homoserine lactone efflux protein